MERKIPFVWKCDCKLLRFFEIGNVSQYDYGFAKNAHRKQRDPQRITQPCKYVYLLLVQLRNVEWIPVILKNCNQCIYFLNRSTYILIRICWIYSMTDFMTFEFSQGSTDT